MIRLSFQTLEYTFCIVIVLFSVFSIPLRTDVSAFSLGSVCFWTGLVKVTAIPAFPVHFSSLTNQYLRLSFIKISSMTVNVESIPLYFDFNLTMLLASL